MKNKEDIVKIFNALSKKDNYKLTKIKNTRPGSMVNAGNTVSGLLKLVEVQGDPAVLVDNSANDTSDPYNISYIRTSPIVEILDNSQTSVVFQTEGGIYQLEKLKESEK